MGKLKVFLYNLKSVHHRIMMRYLRKRGWVVFYLEPKHRVCHKLGDDRCCWLKLYRAHQIEGIKYLTRSQNET